MPKVRAARAASKGNMRVCTEFACPIAGPKVRIDGGIDPWVVVRWLANRFFRPARLVAVAQIG